MNSSATLATMVASTGSKPGFACDLSGAKKAAIQIGGYAIGSIVNTFGSGFTTGKNFINKMFSSSKPSKTTLVVVSNSTAMNEDHYSFTNTPFGRRISNLVRICYEDGDQNSNNTDTIYDITNPIGILPCSEIEILFHKSDAELLSLIDQIIMHLNGGVDSMDISLSRNSDDLFIASGNTLTAGDDIYPFEQKLTGLHRKPKQYPVDLENDTVIYATVVSESTAAHDEAAVSVTAVPEDYEYDYDYDENVDFYNEDDEYFGNPYEHEECSPDNYSPDLKLDYFDNWSKKLCDDAFNRFFDTHQIDGEPFIYFWDQEVSRCLNELYQHDCSFEENCFKIYDHLYEVHYLPTLPVTHL
jgi:hypothetical protein